MFAVTLVILLAGIGTSMAAVDDCPELHFWNGTQCVQCSGCPPGSGVKTKCTSKLDTECEGCWPGYDYSNSSGFERCILCDQYSNCLPGNPKKIKNCTIYSPPVCDGCADGNFFDPGAGMNGGCVKCSAPCNILEDETRPCNTAHNRRCTAKSTEPTTPALSNSSKDSAKEIPNSTNDGGKVQPEDPALAAGGTELPATTPLVKNTRPWVSVAVGVGVGIIAILIIALAVAIIYKRKQSSNRRKDDVNPRAAPTRGEDMLMEQRTPLMGLELPIKNLTIDGRRFIAQRLNGRYHDGYFYWQVTAEKLGLRDECESWKIADNPTEKFLKAYGEKAGSTIGNLVKALRDPDVHLAQIANEINGRFSPPQDQGEPPEHIDDTLLSSIRSGDSSPQDQGEPPEHIGDTNV